MLVGQMALLCGSTTPRKALLCNHDNLSKLLSTFVDSIKSYKPRFSYMPCMNGLCAVIGYFTGKALATQQSML